MEIGKRLVRDLILLMLSDKEVNFQRLQQYFSAEAQLSFCHDRHCSSSLEHHVEEMIREGMILRLDSGILKLMSSGRERLERMPWAALVAQLWNIHAVRSR